MKDDLKNRHAAKKDRARRKSSFSAHSPKREGNHDLYTGGRNSVMEAIRTRQAKKIYVKSGKKDGRLLDIVKEAEAQSILVEEKEPEELDDMTRGVVHQGIVAELKPYQFADLNRVLDENEGKDPFLILLDGVEDVRNLGAIVRTAECAGAAAVLLPKHKSPPVTAAAMKTAAGAFMYLPVCQIGNIRQTLESLKKRGFWVVAADMDGTSLFDEANLKGPLVIVMGAEGKGVSPLTKKMCDFVVRIPLKGHVSSLNVSVAAALIMYAAEKQRR
jgi:23S rRNA (guanosine2251-2'-O)-methyltransferase